MGKVNILSFYSKDIFYHVRQSLAASATVVGVRTIFTQRDSVVDKHDIGVWVAKTAHTLSSWFAQVAQMAGSDIFWERLKIGRFFVGTHLIYQKGVTILKTNSFKAIEIL